MSLRRVCASVALAALAGCVSQRGAEAFNRVMDRQVGKQVDEPDFYPLLYRLRQLDETKLANGNVEAVYQAGPRGRCQVAFEVARGTGRVVRWHAEGEERDCVIRPPQP
jgi:hypothetical protein